MHVEMSYIFETQRGKRCLSINNYKFDELRILKSDDANYVHNYRKTFYVCQR